MRLMANRIPEIESLADSDNLHSDAHFLKLGSNVSTAFPIYRMGW